MAWNARKRRHASWKDHDDDVRAAFPRTAVAEAFEHLKITRGVLALPDYAASIVSTADRIEFSADLTSPGFHTSNFKDDAAARMALSSHFRVVDGMLEGLMYDCVEQLKQPVADALGTPWAIHNVRVWTTPPNAVPSGMYKFHRDGFPWAFYKIMIYFTPMDVEHGSLEIDGAPAVMLTGPACSWLLFANSIIVHRGLPGTHYERACAEITLSRAEEYDLALHQPGLNAHFPLEP